MLAGVPCCRRRCASERQAGGVGVRQAEEPVRHTGGLATKGAQGERFTPHTRHAKPREISWRSAVGLSCTAPRSTLYGAKGAKLEAIIVKLLLV